MAVPTMLYSSESRVATEQDLRQIQASEMNYLKYVTRSKTEDRIRIRTCLRNYEFYQIYQCKYSILSFRTCEDTQM